MDSDPKVIGVRNGVHQGEINWTRFQNPSGQKTIEDYFSLEKYQRNIDTIEPHPFEIEYVDAHKNAALTHFFGFNPKLWGVEFFVEDKVKALLDKFRLPNHSYIPTNIYQHGKLQHYWALYIPYSYRVESIDFPNSVFFEGSPISGKKLRQFRDFEEWNRNKVFRTEKLAFNANFDSTLELFVTSFAGAGYYISGKLKNAIEETHLTGIIITEPKEPELIFP
ncbi:MAG: hypothetical protein EOP53_26905 [Sphingobacteriales bacterium]|nr:MAG: hypothetical protein EOP53_26905 [Sphingobacteriales bacterium]